MEIALGISFIVNLILGYLKWDSDKKNREQREKFEKENKHLQLKLADKGKEIEVIKLKITQALNNFKEILIKLVDLENEMFRMYGVAMGVYTDKTEIRKNDILNKFQDCKKNFEISFKKMISFIPFYMQELCEGIRKAANEYNVRVTSEDSRKEDYHDFMNRVEDKKNNLNDNIYNLRETIRTEYEKL